MKQFMMAKGKLITTQFGFFNRRHRERHGQSVRGGGNGPPTPLQAGANPDALFLLL